jgi:signal transduction histidine kinase
VSLDDMPILKQIVEGGQPVVLDTIAIYSRRLLLDRTEWRRAYVGLPIHSHDEVLGFLNLTSVEPGFFSAERVEALKIFAEQAALAIHNAQLHEQAQTVAMAKERERLARELHDAVSQTLFSANVMAEALPRQWQRNPEKAQQHLAQLHQMTRGAMAEMRTLLLELRPSALVDVDLKTLLTQLSDAVQSRKKIMMTLKLDGPVPLPHEAKLSFYRIAQEALNNVAKHSRATRAEILLKHEDGKVEMVIADNGRGFDPQQVMATSLGLHIMHERAEVIGASLQISTEVGHGTRVEVTWANQPAPIQQ